METSPFEQYLDQTGEKWTSRYLRKPGKSALVLAIEHAERVGVNPEIVEKARQKGMLDGSLEITYEGAERIFQRVREVAQARGFNREYLDVLERLDPIEDHDLIATTYFSLDPGIRDQVQHRLDSLYRVVLNVGAKKNKGYSLPTKQQRSRAVKGKFFSEDLEALIRGLPRREFTGDEEHSRRLRVILERKAERETFSVFKDDPKAAFKLLDKRIVEETNKNLRYTFERVRDIYRGYSDFEALGVNPHFEHPTTHQTGVLPSLHQRIALYHMLREKKFGVFDDCGTGKTAIGTLAQPLISEATGKNGSLRTVVVVGRNNAKKTWKKGLMGNDKVRYLEEELDQHDVAVINGGPKSEGFMESLKDKQWIILNKEQLIAGVNGGGRLVVEELIDMGVDYLIVDESHNVKGRSKVTATGKPTISAATMYLAHNADYVALLTASPIPDNLGDYAVPCHILNPTLCPDIDKFEELYEGNPRILYTLFQEKTIRRSAEQINTDLDWEENDVEVELDPVQRQLYNHIVEFRPRGWLIQARKALLDPRLVDPDILKRAGVLGKVSWRNSAKYKKLEDLVTSDTGAVARGERFVVFSSMFREGVTERGNEGLRRRYAEMGLGLAEYERLELNKSLGDLLNASIKKKFGKANQVGIIDGTITSVEEREKIVDDLGKNFSGILCTTETGGESLDFTRASYAYFLDKDYTPETTRQALKRLVRPGQTRKVNINHFVGIGTLDEQLNDYVGRKAIVTKIASDGYPLTQEEWELINDTEGQQLGELIKRKVGGKSIDVFDATIGSIDDFVVKRRSPGRPREVPFILINAETTEAQQVAKLIGRDPVNCWKDPAFVALYMKAFNNLAVPLVHRAKIMDLVRRARSGEIEMPKTVLSDGSGPSILYSAYHDLAPLIEAQGVQIPVVTDRDSSQLMLDRGMNPNKVLGAMTGEQSAFAEGRFDMVDNESISLLRNPEEVVATLRESHRILRDGGLLEVLVKNQKFLDGRVVVGGKKPDFYTALPDLGFELLTERNLGFALDRKFLQRLQADKGDHFAQSYASKLDGTYFILAKKTGKPKATVDENNFWFAPLKGVEDEGRVSTEHKAGTAEEHGTREQPADEFTERKKARTKMLRKRRKGSKKE